MAMKVSGAEVKDAFMKTQNIEVSSDVVLKVFPDTLMYYAFLEILAILSILAASLPQFRAKLNQRCFRNFSVGECAMMCLLAGMFILWNVYWLHALIQQPRISTVSDLVLVLWKVAA